MKSVVLMFAVLAVAVAAGSARADAVDDRRETEVRRVCSAGTRARVGLRAEDGTLRFRLDLSARRAGLRWSVIVLHERRLVYSGSVRAAGRTASLRRSYADWPGSETVSVRATRLGERCTISASL